MARGVRATTRQKVAGRKNAVKAQVSRIGRHNIPKGKTV